MDSRSPHEQEGSCYGHGEVWRDLGVKRGTRLYITDSAVQHGVDDAPLRTFDRYTDTDDAVIASGSLRRRRARIHMHYCFRFEKQ